MGHGETGVGADSLQIVDARPTQGRGRPSGMGPLLKRKNKERARPI